MPRATNAPASRRRRKKILKQAAGYRGSRHRLLKTAFQAVEHSGQYAYRDRKARKRNFRALWIQRINAAVREHGLTYGRFIDGLNKAGIEVDRKMLADLAIHDKPAFGALAEQAKAALG